MCTTSEDRWLGLSKEQKSKLGLLPTHIPRGEHSKALLVCSHLGFVDSQQAATTGIDSNINAKYFVLPLVLDLGTIHMRL